eukprot:275681-Prymnesium_polylepis.1
MRPERVIPVTQCVRVLTLCLRNFLVAWPHPTGAHCSEYWELSRPATLGIAIDVENHASLQSDRRTASMVVIFSQRWVNQVGEVRWQRPLRAG